MVFKSLHFEVLVLILASLIVDFCFPRSDHNSLIRILVIGCDIKLSVAISKPYIWICYPHRIEDTCEEGAG